MTRLAFMSSVCPDWTLGEVAGAMKEHGYTGFEPRVEWGHLCGIEADMPPGLRRETRELFASEGLEICCLATGVRMAEPDVSERARHVEDLRRYLDLAADLGCGLVRTFGGRRDRDAEWAEVVDYTAAGYRQVVDQAQDAGVTLLLETHDDWSATAPVRAVIEAVGHPCLRVLWDFIHPQRMMETPAESFLAVGMLTRHTHAHDGRCVDGSLQLLNRLGDGEIDHAVPLQLLRRAGFEGYVSVEVINRSGSGYDAEAVLTQHAGELRRLTASPSG